MNDEELVALVGEEIRRLPPFSTIQVGEIVAAIRPRRPDVTENQVKDILREMVGLPSQARESL